MTGFYGSPFSESRHITWNLLRHLRGSDDVPWLVGGEFNALLYQSEKDGGKPKPERELQEFHSVLETMALVDLGFLGLRFT